MAERLMAAAGHHTAAQDMAYPAEPEQCSAGERSVHKPLGVSAGISASTCCRMRIDCWCFCTKLHQAVCSIAVCNRTMALYSFSVANDDSPPPPKIGSHRVEANPVYPHECQWQHLFIANFCYAVQRGLPPWLFSLLLFPDMTETCRSGVGQHSICTAPRPLCLGHKSPCYPAATSSPLHPPRPVTATFN